MTKTSENPGPRGERGRFEELGWDESWAEAFAGVEAEQPGRVLFPGRVIFEAHGRYRLASRQRELDAVPDSATREHRPCVGDWVAFEADGDGPARMVAVLPRRSWLSRKVPGDQVVEQGVAANLDSVFLVMGLDGDFNLRRLERLAVMAWESGAQPVVILTKSDLAGDPVTARLDALEACPGAAVWAISSHTGEGVEPVRSLLEPGHTIALVGSSGAGKSTLVNRLYGEERMATGAVRASDDRGRHTTTHRQLLVLPQGGVVIDNPGIREVQLWAGEEALADAFPEIESFAAGCRFRDCGHREEPGCAVREAVASGRLEPARLESFLKLEREVERLAERRDVAGQRRQQRRLGKMYKRIQRQKRERQGSR